MTRSFTCGGRDTSCAVFLFFPTEWSSKSCTRSRSSSADSACSSCRTFSRARSIGVCSSCSDTLSRLRCSSISWRCSLARSFGSSMGEEGSISSGVTESCCFTCRSVSTTLSDGRPGAGSSGQVVCDGCPVVVVGVSGPPTHVIRTARRMTVHACREEFETCASLIVRIALRVQASRIPTSCSEPVQA